MFQSTKNINAVIFCIVFFAFTTCISCKSASNITQQPVANDNRDVVALSFLIRDYMRKTGNTNFTLSDIVKNDTSGSIAKNFTEVAVGNWPSIWRGGFCVYFKFSAARDKDTVKFLPYQTHFVIFKTKRKIGRTNNELVKAFDGEIHFYYPERHYNVASIIMKSIN